MRRRASHVIVRCLVAVLAANAAFLAAMYLASGDPAGVAERTRSAFAAGELGQEDFLLFDARRGYFQYVDCLVLQMLSNPTPSRWHRALAPVVYHADEEGNGSCATLHRLVVERTGPAGLLPDPYSRYWHGQNVAAGLGLRFMELVTLRRAMVGAVYAMIAVLAAVSLRRGPHVRIAGLAISFAAATFWAVPYMAPGFSFAPVDVILLTGLVALAARPSLAASADAIAVHGAVFGACVVFAELLTGELVMAATWLVALTLAAARDVEPRGGASGWRVAATALVACVLGVTVTVVLKQLIAPLVDVTATGNFLSHLEYYTTPSPAGRVPSLVLPFARMASQLPMLTYGSLPLATVLAVAVALLWGLAVLRGWRSRQDWYGRDVLILDAAALSPALWTILWSTHTKIHAQFMVRMAVVPIALSLIAFFWPRPQPAPHPHA